MAQMKEQNKTREKELNKREKQYIRYRAQNTACSRNSLGTSTA